MRVLVIEDVEEKFSDVLAVIVEMLPPDVDISRAYNLNEAEDKVGEGRWDLMILDLSMDISSSKALDTSSGHATLGGLDVLERMFLLRIAVPTVLVTGFDSFQDLDRFQNSIMYLNDIQNLAREWIGSSYLGYVRYGPAGWDKKLKKILSKWNPK